MPDKQILKEDTLICSVQNGRKVKAILKTAEGEILPIIPETIMQEFKTIWLFFDSGSISLPKLFYSYFGIADNIFLIFYTKYAPHLEKNFY